LKFEQFALERWLSETRFNCDVDLSASVITHFKYNELVNEKDLDVPVRIGPTNGSEDLRAEISKLYSGTVGSEGVLVTHGAAEANFLLLNCLISPGDECIFVVPNYMQAYGILRSMGARVKLAHLDEKKNYALDLEEIRGQVSKKTKAILVTNPNNPTGARLTIKELKTLCGVAEEAKAYVIADEVLSGLEIDGTRTVSAVEIYEKGISTRSVSKLGFSGLRVGWIAARDHAIAKKCWMIRDYTSLGNSFFNQHVALMALRNIGMVSKRNRSLLSNRVETLIRGIKENRSFLSCTKPKAGSTALVKYKPDTDSVEFCRSLAKKEGVAVSPGDFFKAGKSFRILYGTDAEKLKTGLRRIGRFVRNVA
jgi:aspartate/methionine/tyrosine aminotransferase